MFKPSFSLLHCSLNNQDKKLSEQLSEIQSTAIARAAEKITAAVRKQVGKIAEQKVFAIKPLTFMNNSGVCIKELIDYFKIDVKDVFVFHDDMDIDIGKIKTKIGGSNAGHNGIDSLDKNIGKNYSRIRIGIGRPKKNATGAEHVLDNFSGDEKQNVEKVTKDIIESLSILMNKDLDLFSSKINQK